MQGCINPLYNPNPISHHRVVNQQVSSIVGQDMKAAISWRGGRSSEFTEHRSYEVWMGGWDGTGQDGTGWRPAAAGSCISRSDLHDSGRQTEETLKKNTSCLDVWLGSYQLCSGGVRPIRPPTSTWLTNTKSKWSTAMWSPIGQRISNISFVFFGSNSDDRCADFSRSKSRRRYSVL